MSIYQLAGNLDSSKRNCETILITQAILHNGKTRKIYQADLGGGRSPLNDCHGDGWPPTSGWPCSGGEEANADVKEYSNVTEDR